MENPIIDFLYLISIILFIIGLKRLSHPDSARKGNMIAGIGMGLAIVITIFYPMENESNNYGWIIGGLILGGAIGWVAAKKIKMTAMFVGFFFIAASPWFVKNFAETRSFSVNALLTGKDALPKISVQLLEKNYKKGGRK